MAHSADVSAIGDRGAGGLVSRGDRPRVFSKGRECAARGCMTTLSVYNPLPLCYFHERETQAVKIKRETGTGPSYR